MAFDSACRCLGGMRANDGDYLNPRKISASSTEVDVPFRSIGSYY